MRNALINASTLAIVALSLSATPLSAKWHPKPKPKAKPVATRPIPQYQAAGSNVLVSATNDLTLSIGQGRMVALAEPIGDIFTADPGIADVNVRSDKAIYVFGKGAGATTIYATNKAGKIVYSTVVRVGQNLTDIGQMLHTAMPEAALNSTTINGMVILSGTVRNPEDAATAETLVNGYIGNDVSGKGPRKFVVINRIKTATPQQVNLQVRIAEVSRSVAKNIGASLLNRDTAGTGGAIFGVSTGRSGAVSIGNKALTNYPTRDFSTQLGYPAGTIAALPYDPANPSVPINPVNPGAAYSFGTVAGQTLLGIGGRLLGMDVGAALDLAETDGDVHTLAQPNLTALSGETASFLAGGEIPVPVASGSGGLATVSVEYKPYGVSLSFTPLVLSDGRISLHVKPEVSELTSQGAVTINGFTVPALTTRRSETTVELGSGQSMVISGLLQNNSNNSTTKAPGLGDVPVLGALFRSNSYSRGESELMIVVTPYLVKPVNANEIVLPTDNVKAPTDLERVLLGRTSSGRKTPDARTKPSMATPETKAAPAVGALDLQAPAHVTPPPAAEATVPAATVGLTPNATPSVAAPKAQIRQLSADAAPGFGS